MSSLTKKQILSRGRAKTLESVKNLNLWGSNLSDVSVVSELPNVEVLSLSVNSISSLKDFAYCPRLKELYLRKNCINDLNEIGFLKKLPKLRVLWLSDNPCAEGPNYRLTVIKNLPKLIRLDNVAIDESEVSSASATGDDIATPVDLPDYPDLGDTMASTMGSTKSSQSLKRSNSKDSTDQCVPSISTNQQEVTRASLVDETNKLRAELGIKPLVLDEPKEKPSAIKTLPDSRSSSVSPTPTDTRNSNILSAVLSLLKELDEGSLEAVRNEIDTRLEEFNKEESCTSSKPMIEEVLAD
ncbi:cilia- and flagella-associated protein 410-like [Actinia tenebrosa]|uniref:Cilia- and flagella-associated protein 410-like n=1 Tax=Actinia tenebrosa TaxID=6105 RepID=A0A6P8HP66_ACTTE|nr:cilia- and flagella-associated protein 410-like [Actinia tenebrosa]